MNITASTFRVTLLVVLRELAGEGGVVTSKEATDEVLSRHGISRSDLGTDNTGRDLAPLLVNQCFNKLLKRKDLAHSAGYGKWALTPDGISAADSERNTMETSPDTEGGGISFAVPTSDQHYHPDPYIRDLAAKATPCYGHWSRRSQVCGRCTLSNTCITETMQVMEDIAAKLDERDYRISRGMRVEEDEDKDILDAINSEDEEPREDRDWSDYTIPHETIRAEVVCPHCSNSASENVVQVVQMNPYGVQPGIYHEACFEEFR